MPTEIRTASHVAYVDVLTGQGCLVLPDPRDDVRDPLTAGSLHAADWTQMLVRLDSLGWELSESDDGGWLDAGMTRDGRCMVGLYGRDPLMSDPDLSDLVAADEALRQLADGGPTLTS